MKSKDLIKIFEVKGREGNVYCIGPFGRRVNFASQQIRSLNLVWALKEMGKLDGATNAAVIGGGLSGLTVAAGLIGYGCSVDVFEESTETLADQRHTTHRLVHPTINRWPEEKMELTTKLPFLEWSAGRCSDVARSIAKQFDKIIGDNNVYLGHKVISFSDIAARNVGLTVEPVLKNADEGKFYNIVIIAAGFGEEETLSGFEPNSYWWPDNLENLRDKWKLSKFLVSGCGDGGLIDALRLAHHKFEDGQLIFDIADMLSDTKIAIGIERAEQEAFKTNDFAALTSAYQSAAEQIDRESEYREVSQRLTDSYKANHSCVVYLLDKSLASPFTTRSAPINKLLVAHARLKNKIHFKTGVPKRKGAKVEFANFEPIDLYDKEKKPASKVVVRHGPKTKFHGLLDKIQISDIKKKQEENSAETSRKLWPGCFPVPNGLPSHDIDNPEFVQSRLYLARKAIDSICTEFDLDAVHKRFRIRFKGEIPKNAPKALFGVPVEHSKAKALVGIL